MAYFNRFHKTLHTNRDFFIIPFFFSQARPLQTSELSKPNISSAIARKMAHIHSLNVPISKNPDFVYDLMFHWLQELLLHEDTYKPKNLELFKEFKNYDLLSEVAWLKYDNQSGDYILKFK